MAQPSPEASPQPLPEPSPQQSAGIEAPQEVSASVPAVVPEKQTADEESAGIEAPQEVDMSVPAVVPEKQAPDEESAGIEARQEVNVSVPAVLPEKLAPEENKSRPATAAEKQVFLIRHGEGYHNRGNNGLLDPKLTERGLKQALSLRADPALNANGGPELLVVSPLSRAVQTAAAAFGERPRCRTVLSPLHSERWSHLCDQGRPKTALAADFPFVREWDGFAELAEDWTPTKETDRQWRKQRPPAFLMWLKAQPERRIAVVGHGAFFGAIIGKHLSNCQVFELRLKPDAKRSDVPCGA